MSLAAVFCRSPRCHQEALGWADTTLRYSFISNYMYLAGGRYLNGMFIPSLEYLTEDSINENYAGALALWRNTAAQDD